MNKLITLFLIAGLWSCAFQTESSTEEFEPNWESLKNYEIPEWFADAKFGIFIHWGPYCVPEFGSEWYPRFMYMDSLIYSPTGELEKVEPSWVYHHHIKTYGTLDTFGYKDFIPQFTGENFNATQWISLFADAGAKYVVPVAEHHDAFAMYNSNVSHWNSVEMGPKRDVLGELFEAGRKQGLKMGASSHFAFNWNYFNRDARFDSGNPHYADLYGTSHEAYDSISEEFKSLWWKRTIDIVDNYKPDILWFDFYFDRPEFNDYHPKIAAYYYNKGLEWDKEVVLQDKNFYQESFKPGTFVHDIERGKLSEMKKFPWQTDTSVGKNSWCYVKNWESRTAESLIHDLIDIVSKNGNLLLNVGPKKDGTIPADQVQVLKDMGSWLAVNGEAIYETRPWIYYGEGPTKVATGHHSEGQNQAFTANDFRFTTKENMLYAIAMAIPTQNELLISRLGLSENSEKVLSVELLGHDNPISFKQSNEGLTIAYEKTIQGNYACCFKIELQKK